ncbi:unnamed protein product [Aphanomyces euteiches]
MVFQPTVVESELFRFLRALSVLPNDHVLASTTADNLSADRLGQYLKDETLLASGRTMDVMAYFGKQVAVEQQLTTDGWWPHNLSSQIKMEEEGVYALTLNNMEESNGVLRVVLFGWLTTESFEGVLLRERATYVLRFLTTLTSNVVCCLAPRDVICTKRPAPNSEVVTSSKKYSVSFSIQTAKVEEEQVGCELSYEAGWGEAVEGGKLVSSPNVSLAVVKSDRNIVMERSSRYVKTANEFAKWLVKTMQTYSIDAQCQLPKSWVARALEVHGQFPRELMDSMTEDAVLHWDELDTAAKVQQEIDAMLTRCEENAAKVFYVDVDGVEEELTASNALMYDMQVVRGWYFNFSPVPNARLVDFDARIYKLVNDEYARLQEISQGSEKNGWFGWLGGWKETKRMSFPYLLHGDIGREALANISVQLATGYEKWCQLLRQALHSDILLESRISTIQAALEECQHEGSSEMPEGPSCSRVVSLHVGHFE